MGDGIYGSEGFYYGENSSLNSDTGYAKYRLNSHGLGFPGSPKTANQVSEAVKAIKQGVTAFEVEALDADTSETIPKEHFKEMRQLMKISGIRPSMHAPLIDPTGFSKNGKWNEENMVNNERRMFTNIQKAHELDPKGNTPVVFHSTVEVPGAEYKKDAKGNIIKQRELLIDQESGNIIPIEVEKRYSPYNFSKGGIAFDLQEQMNSLNVNEWDKKQSELAMLNKNINEIISQRDQSVLYSIDEELKKSDNPDEKLNELVRSSPDYVNALKNVEKARFFIDNLGRSFDSAFDKIYRYGSDEQRTELQKLAKDYSEDINNLNKERNSGKVGDFYIPVKNQIILEEYIMRLNNIGKGNPLNIFVNAEEFAMNKAAETFGNLAVKSYNTYKDNAPVIAIENMFQGMAFSRGSQMKDLVEKSRENFVNQMVDSKKMTRKQAEKVAEKQIGMTLDVGHLNIHKKTGMTDEDLQKEVAEMAPYVKHLHLTDNFGYADTHLAPGMGNVPFKKIFEELEKQGKLDEINKIIEAGAFVAQYDKSPFPNTLAAMNSSIYGAKLESSWAEAQSNYGNYFGGYGKTNPEVHHSLYGSGFTTLPTELGGSISGQRSRFSGDKMD